MSATPRHQLIRKRYERGMSIRTAAAAMGINKDTLARLEEGGPITSRGLPKAKAIADYYGDTMADLFPELFEEVGA